MNDKPTLNIQEVANLLGVNRQTLSAAAKQGSIPCVRIGDRIVFSRSAIEGFLETGRFEGSGVGQACESTPTYAGIGTLAIVREIRRQSLMSEKATTESRLAEIERQLERLDREEASARLQVLGGLRQGGRRR